jgi:hypothetical protein
MRPLRNGTLCPISASGSNFNPRNILYIPVVEIFAFFELEQKLPFFKGLSILQRFRNVKIAPPGGLHGAVTETGAYHN